MNQILYDLKDGILYLYAGQKLFFREKWLWKFALLPLLMIAMVYAGLILAAYFLIYPEFLNLFSALGERFDFARYFPPWFCGLFLTILFCIVIFFTIEILYQCFSAFIFDSMIECFEARWFHFSSNFDRKKQLELFRDGLRLSTRNALLSILFLVIQPLVPIIGPVIGFLMLGYLFGIAGIQGCAANHGIRSREFLKEASRNFLLITAFGCTASLLLLLPFATFFLSPGFVLSGCLIYNEKFSTE